MVRVSCAENEYVDPDIVYVMQVFSADKRLLLTTGTSLTPTLLEVTDLPTDISYSGLLLYLRVKTSHTISDATVIHSLHSVQDGNTQEHQRNPGRIQIFNGSPYRSSTSTTVRPLCPILFQ